MNNTNISIYCLTEGAAAPALLLLQLPSWKTLNQGIYRLQSINPTGLGFGWFVGQDALYDYRLDLAYVKSRRFLLNDGFDSSSFEKWSIGPQTFKNGRDDRCFIFSFFCLFVYLLRLDTVRKTDFLMSHTPLSSTSAGSH